MGILQKLRWSRDILTQDSSVVLPPIRGDVAQVSHLPVGVAEAFGINLNTDAVSRDQAMAIPAMRRGRQIIAATIGTAPLVCIRQIADRAPERIVRSFFKQPDPNCTLAFLLTWTVDDLLFYGLAWWFVTKRDSQGFPANAMRISNDRLSIDRVQGKVYIDRQEVNPLNLIRFDGPDEGVLKHGARSLKTSLMLEEAVRRYARMDVPLGILEDQEGALEEAEIQTFLDAWERARLARTTGYLPHGLKYNNPTSNAKEMQLTEARMYQAAEIARLLNLPPSAVNAPTNDSLTYSTTESNRRELVDMTYAPFIAAIEQRLSMPDVTPAGTSVYVDFSKFIRGDLTTVLSAAKTGIEAGVLLPDEIRVDWLNMAPLPAKENNDGTSQEQDPGTADQESGQE